jgi:hypothetical protein
MAMVVGAMLAMAGTAMAAEYRSKQNGNWNQTTTWEEKSGVNWRPATAVPTSGDIATVLNGHTVTVSSNSQQITTLAVQTGGTLVISSTMDLSLAGSGPSAAIDGTFTVSGTFNLNSSSGTPYIAVRSTQSIPATGGVVVGQVASEIRIDANSAAVTMTNDGTIRSLVTIYGINTGSNAAAFSNHGVVKADAAGSLLIDAASPTANFSISDNGSAKWVVDVNGSAVLVFNKGFTGSGALEMKVSGGAATFNDSVTVGSLLYNLGTINVAASKSLTSGTAPSGSCGTMPANPLNGATSFSACP